MRKWDSFFKNINVLSVTVVGWLCKVIVKGEFVEDVLEQNEQFEVQLRQGFKGNAGENEIEVQYVLEVRRWLEKGDWRD